MGSAIDLAKAGIDWVGGGAIVLLWNIDTDRGERKIGTRGRETREGREREGKRGKREGREREGKRGKRERERDERAREGQTDKQTGDKQTGDK